MLQKLSTFDLINSTYIAQSIYTLIKIDIFDKLIAGKSSSQNLANSCSINAAKLQILLDLAVSMDFLGQKDNCYFLRKKGMNLTRAVNSWERDYFTIWAEGLQSAAAQTPAWLTQDMNAYETANGATIWEHYRTNRALGKSFEKFQDRISHLAHLPELTKIIQLHAGERFLDIAGGKGALAFQLAIQNPQAVGAVLDQPHMEPIFQEHALEVAEQAGVAQVTFIVGNMLKHIPTGFNTYLIKHALHDWDDESVCTVLMNIAQAMDSSSRLLIIEGVKQPQHKDNVLMQARAYEQAIWTCGKLRTLSDFENLLQRSGLKIRDMQETNVFDLSILECIKQ